MKSVNPEYLRIALALVGIGVNLETSEIIITTIDQIEAKGGRFTIYDAVKIKNESDKRHAEIVAKRVEPKTLVPDWISKVQQNEKNVEIFRSFRGIAGRLFNVLLMAYKSGDIKYVEDILPWELAKYRACGEKCVKLFAKLREEEQK